MPKNTELDPPRSVVRDFGDTWISWFSRVYEFLGSYGEFTATLTGCTTSPTGTVRYVRVGRIITLNIPAISATSNTTAATLTGGVPEIMPETAATCICRVIDNGTTKTGLAVIGTDGVITLYNGTSGAAFTNSGTKGTADVTITYMVK